MLLSLIPLWLVRYPPLQDYPDWLLQAQILRRLHDPAWGFSEHYLVRSLPVPNLGSIALIYLLSFLVSIETAGKLALSVALVGLPLSILYFLRKTQGRTSAVELMALLVGYNYFFYRGYLGYVLGLALLFGLLGFAWSRWDTLSWADLVILAGGSTVLFLIHLIPWAVLAFVVLSWAWLTRRQWGLQRLGLSLLALAPSLVLLALYMVLSNRPLVVVPYRDLLLKLTSWLEALFVAFHFEPWGSPQWPLALNLLGLALMGLIIWWAWRLARREHQPSEARLWDWRLLAPALGLMVLVAVLPAWLAGVLRPDERLTMPAFVLALAAVRWSRPDRRLDALLMVLVGGLLLFNAAVMVQGSRVVEQVVASLRPYVSQDEHPYFLRVPCLSSLSAVEKLVPVINPAARAGFYLTVEQGGNNRQIFDTGIVAVRTPFFLQYRMPWPRKLPDLVKLLPGLEEQVLDDYTTVALIGCPEPVRSVATLLAASYRPVQQDSASPYVLVLGAARQGHTLPHRPSSQE